MMHRPGRTGLFQLKSAADPGRKLNILGVSAVITENSRGGKAVMTSIFSLVIVFMATFLLVFAYLTHPEPGSRHADAEPPASVSEFAR
jgi:hypothetical protein